MISVTEKPWGTEELMGCINEKVTPKIMSIKAGHRNSLHYHKNKDEIVYCISGTGILQNNTDLIKLTPRSYNKVSKHVAHRVTALSDLKLLEISIGEYDENDITRMEDDYGRIP